VENILSETIAALRFASGRLDAIIIRDPRDVRAKLTKVAGDKYRPTPISTTFDLIGRTVSGRARDLQKSQRRRSVAPSGLPGIFARPLAEYGLQPAALGQVLRAATLLRREAHSRRPAEDHYQSLRQFESRDAIGEVAVAKTRLELRLSAGIWSRFFPAIKLPPHI